MRKPGPIRRISAPLDRLTVSATEAQNEFGRILDSVSGDRVVVITRHNTARAVLMSIERFDAMSGIDVTILDTLTDEFDAMLQEMQTPGARRAIREAFNASPDELGRAAVEAASPSNG